MKFKQKHVVAIVLSLVLLVALLMLLKDSRSGSYVMKEYEQGSVKKVGISNAPAGWQTYTSTEFGFAFAYPTNWTLSEQRLTEEGKRETLSSRPVGSLSTVRLDGDGYIIIFTKSGHGIAQDAVEQQFTHPNYQIDGINATVFEIEKGFGFSQSFRVEGEGKHLLIDVTSTGKSKSLSDQVLSTISFTN